MAQGGESMIGFQGIFEEAASFLDQGRVERMMALAVIPISPMRRTAMERWPENLTSSRRKDLYQELEVKLQERLSGYNEWLCREAREDGRMEPVIAADATLDRDYMLAEIESKVEHYRIKALKIHPAANELSPAHEGYQAIFELAMHKDLIVITHGGLAGNDLEGKYCSPVDFRRVLELFPRLKLVVAHLAYPHTEGMVELACQFPNLYTDISFVLDNTPLTDDDFCKIIRRFDPGRVLFGSDFPWSDPGMAVDRMLRLKLDQDELEMLAWKNASGIFGLS